MDERTICKPGYVKKAGRPTRATERQVCAEYGETHGCPGRGFKIDHLVPTELGGSDDIRNLWLEPAGKPGHPGFQGKRMIEEVLRAEVCAGTIALAEAQAKLRADWYTALSQGPRGRGSLPLAGRDGYGTPACLRCPNPPAYLAAAVKGDEEIVVLQFVVTPAGTTENIQVAFGSGLGFDRGCVDTVRKWRFKPATGPDGKPAAVVMTAVMRFNAR